MTLETAAAISGVIPGASAASATLSATGESSHSRNAPTVRLATGAKAAGSWVSRIRRVTSSSSAGTTACRRKSVRGTWASAICAAARSTAVSAARPARTSPERSGEALASNWHNVGKTYLVPSIAVA